MKTLKRILFLILTLSLLISLCSCGKEKNEVIVSDVPIIEASLDAETDGSSPSAGHSAFILRFFPSSSLNPITCTDRYNDVITSLIYEGLFRLDKHFRPEKVLCDSYTTEDGKQFFFSLISATMHDGSALTATDAAYSINLARSTTRYSSRLSNIKFCGVTEDGLLEIDLETSDYSLPALLDIPIIEYGTGNDYSPVGTGPYVYNETGNYHHLSAFSQHRSYETLPYNAVYLRSIADGELVENFDEGQLSLLWDDAIDDTPVNLYATHENRRYDTSILQYIGFSSSSTPMNDINLRRAVACCIDRDHIVKDIYGGNVRSAPLILNSGYYAYSELWESAWNYSMKDIKRHLDASELLDTNGDGYLEYPVFGEYQPMFITFVVYSGNSQKVAIARDIAQKLRSAGLYIDLEELDWADYLKTVQGGYFDLYLAETSLPQNFDFTPLLSPGGKLDYGEMGTSSNSTLCHAFLDAVTDEEKLAAAKELCTTITDKVTIIPLVYRQYNVYTHRGAISDFTPTISGIFSNITEWKIN